MVRLKVNAVTTPIPGTLLRLFAPSVGFGETIRQVLDRHGHAERGVIAKPAKARDCLRSIRRRDAGIIRRWREERSGRIL